MVLPICAVCLEVFCFGNHKDIVALPCSHVFHSHCVAQHYKRIGCPKCRAKYAGEAKDIFRGLNFDVEDGNSGEEQRVLELQATLNSVIEQLDRTQQENSASAAQKFFGRRNAAIQTDDSSDDRSTVSLRGSVDSYNSPTVYSEYEASPCLPIHSAQFVDVNAYPAIDSSADNTENEFVENTPWMVEEPPVVQSFTLGPDFSSFLEESELVSTDFAAKEQSSLFKGAAANEPPLCLSGEFRIGQPSSSKFAKFFTQPQQNSSLNIALPISNLNYDAPEFSVAAKRGLLPKQSPASVVSTGQNLNLNFTPISNLNYDAPEFSVAAKRGLSSNQSPASVSTGQNLNLNFKPFSRPASAVEFQQQPRPVTARRTSISAAPAQRQKVILKIINPETGRSVI